MKRLTFIIAMLTLFGSFSLTAAETPVVKVGEKAPDFTLTSAENKSVSLSDFQGKDIVLIFSRAHWWPYCVKHLVQLQENKAAFDKMGIQMICIFREERDGLAGLKKAAAESKFSPILLDSPADKTKAYSQDGFATYLISKDSLIKAELSGSKKTRPSAETILSKAKEVFSPAPWS